MKSFLFVCLGNICRSPTAEAVFKFQAKQAGYDFKVSSAGTGAWHVNVPCQIRVKIPIKRYDQEYGV